MRDAADPDARRIAETVGGGVQAVTIWPGQQVEVLLEQLARVPPEAAFLEAFGDTASVLVYGPPDVDASRLTALRAVVAALGPDDDLGSPSGGIW
jgi:uncharacterized repeat protein (TIGR03917 family)